MTYRGFLSRAEIGLRAPKSRSTNIDASRGGCTGHYAGKAQGVNTDLSGHNLCLSLWRGYQRYHMDTHGWVDIAYTLGVCQHGYILAGRGANVRTAANGTNAGNSYWYAICWIGGGNEKPTRDAIDAFWAAVAMLQRDGGAANRVNDHSDHKATTCAGDPMRTVIDAGPTSSGGTDMATDHNHNLEKMPDWGGAEKEIWDRFFGDGITSVRDSWKWVAHRLDLAWQYVEVILPIKNEVKQLREEVKQLREEVKQLRSELDQHKAGHATGDASGGTVDGGPYAPKDHGHEIKVVTE